MILKNSNRCDDFVKVIKYLFSSGTSFVLDLLLFTIFNYFFKSIFLATVFARVISSLYNYFINSRFVFKNYHKKSIYGYYLLVLIQMIVSSSVVSVVSSILSFVNDTFIKFFVDIIIFVVNYFIQKKVIFK